MDSVVAEVRNVNIFWQPVQREGRQEFPSKDVIGPVSIDSHFRPKYSIS